VEANKRRKILMNIYETWIGYGVKIGGTLGIVGGETADGKVCNLGYTDEVYPLNISSVRVGPGLGGGVGVVAIMVFNCIVIQGLNDESVSDWSINVSIGGKWSDLVKGLKKRRFFGALARTAGDLTNASPEDVTKIRNAASYMYTAVEMNNMGGGYKIIVLDIPGAGIGVELSWSPWINGVITIGDLITPLTSEETNAWTEGGSGSGPGT